MKKLLLSYNVRISSLILIMIILLSTIGCSSLNKAIRKDDTEKVISLLEKGKVDINKVDTYGGIPLIYAVRGGHIEIVKLLIEAGADLDALTEEVKIDDLWNRTTNSYTALMTAAHSQQRSKYDHNYDDDESVYTEIAKLLIEAGADINVENDVGNNALTIATSEEMAILLIEAGIGGNSESNKWDEALRGAAVSSYVNAVKLLLKNGVNIKGSDALIYAVKGARGHYNNDNFEIINLFLEAGADINATEAPGGWTALIHACASAGRVELIKLLLDAGADVNVKSFNWSALRHAMSRSNNNEVIQLLIDYGAEYKVIITY